LYLCRKDARREHIPIIAELLNADETELLTLWLADKVTAIVTHKKDFTIKALDIAKENIKK
jgi:hypothetical protein